MGGTNSLASADKEAMPSSTSSSSSIRPLDDPLHKPWFDTKQLTSDLQALLLKLGGPTEGAILQGGLELMLRHICQEATWDCGVSCLQMAMDYAQWPGDFTREVLLRQVGTQSIWTVDLLFLLKEYVMVSGRTVIFATKAPGVCSQYSEVAFYARQFDADRERVMRLFRTARTEGLGMYEGTLRWEILRDLVMTSRVLIILLVDSRFLRPQALAMQPPPSAAPSAPLTPSASLVSSVSDAATIQQQQPQQQQQQQQYQQQPPIPSAQPPSTPLPSSLPAPSSSSSSSSQPPVPPAMPTSYCGHYILLTGYRAHPPAFFYKDPARPRVSCTGDHIISVAGLDEARKSYGTDEDVLIIEIPPSIAPAVSSSSSSSPHDLP